MNVLKNTLEGLITEPVFVAAMIEPLPRPRPGALSPLPTSQPARARPTSFVARGARSRARGTLGWGCGAHDTRMRQPLSQPPPVGLDARRVSYVRQEEGSREDASPFPPLLSFLKLEYRDTQCLGRALIQVHASNIIRD